jgi:hypothetical protein
MLDTLCLLDPLLDSFLIQILVHLFLRGLRIHNCTWPVEDLSDLLETTTFGFREVEVCDREEDGQQAAEDDVVLISNVLHADGIAEGCDDQGGVDREKLTGKSFGSIYLSVLWNVA